MTTDTMTTETTTDTATTDSTTTQPIQQDASGHSPTEPPQGTPRERGERKRWVELVAAAAIAAVVGSGATLALTDPLSSDATPLAATSSAGTTQPGVASPNTAGTGQDWTTVAAKASPAVVAISVQGPQGGDEGSGVIWDSAGNIVTNNHVVASAGQGGTVQVRVGAQSTYEAKVVGTDPTTDLAVVRLVSPPKDLTAIGRASADSLQVGDPVMALGNPLGLSGTVTTGIVSALDRPVTTQAVTSQDPQGFTPAAATSAEVVTDAIQTSAAINPGNSGGALVDASGNLVGINSSIASLSSGQGQAGNIGIGFAIPVQEVQTVVGQLLKGGTVAHASLGVSVADATLTKGTATIAGAGIKGVTAGSAAAKAGLATGDVVTAVDGRPVDSAEGLVGRVRGMAVGDQVKLTVTGSNGQERTVTATLTARS